MSDATLGINLPGNKPQTSPGVWSSYHRRGAHVLMANGSVRWLDQKTDPRILKALTTADARDHIEEF